MKDQTFSSQIIMQTHFQKLEKREVIQFFFIIVVLYGRCLLLLLRIRSANLEILRFPMGGAY